LFAYPAVSGSPRRNHGDELEVWQLLAATLTIDPPSSFREQDFVGPLTRRGAVRRRATGQ